jgi:HD-like signal output (HDOD) protein/DNA-binding CsgD family transcriptional regulator
MQATIDTHAPQRRTAARPVTSSRRPGTCVAAGQRHPHEGHGRRLTMAFEALDTLPALAAPRDRLLAALAEESVITAEVVFAIESDVALVIAVLRLANAAQPGSGHVETVTSAVEALPAEALCDLAENIPTFDFFVCAEDWEAVPERFRLHAVATQRITDRIACEVGYKHRDRLAVTSLLHDIGKLVFVNAYPGYPARIHAGATTPEQRLRQERRELGVDHALVGGVLARRWGLPGALASAVECHHNPDAEGEAAFIQLADMLAHYEQGEGVSKNMLRRAAYAVGLGPEDLRRLMYELPSGPSQRKRHVDPCPLSDRELSVLQGLAKGGIYKQVAEELELSTSTVRSHLHNIYGKLGALDRAQAVLMASARGWI